MPGFKSLRRAQIILSGIEIVLMLRKGLHQTTNNDKLMPVAIFYHLAA